MLDGIIDGWKGEKQSITRACVRFKSMLISHIQTLTQPSELTIIIIGTFIRKCIANLSLMESGRQGCLSRKGSQSPWPYLDLCYQDPSEILLTLLADHRLPEGHVRRVPRKEAEPRTENYHDDDQVYMSMTPTVGGDRKCEKFLN